MVRRRSKGKAVVTSADCMRRKRQTLRDVDFVQCKLQIPRSFGERLKRLKAAHNMRGLDSVVSAMIRKVQADHGAHELRAPPPPADYDDLRQIAVHIPREHHAFLEAVSHRNRGINLGIALETVGHNVHDLTPSPRQLSLLDLLENAAPPCSQE